MKRNWLSLVVIVAVALSVWGGLPAVQVRAASVTVVIGEVQTRGSAGASDEFVEIYNLSGSSVVIDGYLLRYQSCTGTGLATQHTVPAGTTLGAYGHYLIGSAAYDGPTSRNGALSGGIADCGQLQLQTNSGTPVDTLVFTWAGGTVPTNGWVNVEGAYFGSNPHNNTTGTNQDTSFARLPNTLSAVGGHKNGQDTDVNATDFVATATSSPENTSSPTAVTLSDLSASTTASPAPIAFGLMGVAAALLLRRKLTRASTQN